MRIRVSYELEPELLGVIALLGKRVLDVKREPAKGQYRRAYIVLKDLPKNAEQLAKQG